MRKRVEQLPPVSSELRTRAIELRKKMNEAERKIWHNLRGRQLGAFFHRQRVIGRYICDFVSLDSGLIVEVDGSQHVTVEGKAYDSRRDKYLRSLGFRVLRFSDYDVLKNMEGVISTILNSIK
jgi:very-short-patch-repair endonuclease